MVQNNEKTAEVFNWMDSLDNQHNLDKRKNGLVIIPTSKGDKRVELKDSAFVHFEKAQELNKSLIAGYAEMIEFGLGTNKDPGYALTCYEEGISAGEDLYEKAYALRYVIQHMINNDLNEEAYKNYQMYIITCSAKNDEKGSLKYLKASSDAGFVPAMCDYADYLRQGELVEKNLEEAVRLYKVASDAGYLPAMFNYVYTYNLFDNSITLEENS